MRCRVGKCKQSNSKKSTGGKPVHFYHFPKDAAQRKLWIEFCNPTRSPINTQTDCICSLHFKPEDFQRNLKFELGFSNRRAPKLKPGVVPTIEMSAIPCEAQSNPCPITNEIEPPAGINEESLQLYIKTLETKMDALRQENDELKISQSRSRITINKLYSQVQSLSFAKGKLEEALGRIFTESQIKKS